MHEVSAQWVEQYVRIPCEHLQQTGCEWDPSCRQLDISVRQDPPQEFYDDLKNAGWVRFTPEGSSPYFEREEGERLWRLYDCIEKDGTDHIYADGRTKLVGPEAAEKLHVPCKTLCVARCRVRDGDKGVEIDLKKAPGEDFFRRSAGGGLAETGTEL